MARAKKVLAKRAAAREAQGNDRTVASNRRARHDYDILETYECGIVLQGSEVKSLREGKAQLTDAYARVDDGELWLFGVHIPPWRFATGWGSHDPERKRKLLVHRKEVDELMGRSQQEMFKSAGTEIIDMTRLDILMGSGGVLSHAPRREQAALMLMDSFEPIGFTELAVDSVFMTPHLGVLASLHPDIAAEVFDKDCLVPLGTCISPVGKGRDGRPAMKVGFNGQSLDINFGDLVRVPLGADESAEVEATPLGGLDLGAGPNKPVKKTVKGGLVGLIFDCRGRPLQVPTGADRPAKLLEWLRAMNAYPLDELNAAAGGGALEAAATEVKEVKKGGLFSRIRGR